MLSSILSQGHNILLSNLTDLLQLAADTLYPIRYSRWVELPNVKPLEWLGNTRRAVLGFPKPVRQVVGQALYAAQLGDKHQDAKPLKGFGGASVVEIVSDYDGDTFRAVYTVRFHGVVYTLHAFQKKSKGGIKTPKKELALVKQRLREAEQDYRERYTNG